MTPAMTMRAAASTMMTARAHGRGDARAAHALRRSVSSLAAATTAMASRRRRTATVTRADAFAGMSEKLDKAWARLAGEKDLNAENVKEPLKDVRRALLEADVSLPVVRRFIKRCEEKAVGQKVTKGVEPGQMLVKVVADELCELMGGIGADGIEFRDDGEPTVILMAGLQGVGKTTACGKLALALRKQGKSVLMVATDVYRPAAIDQLKTLGTQIGVPVFDMGVDGNPPEIAARGVRKAKDEDIDVVIVDTAGRLNIDEKLMGELKATKMATNADETLLVVDAMTGQEAATLTASFNDAVEITGAILTKMDGDTRGGAALSVREVSGKPIKFTGVGEKMDALEPFYPERMTSRILGMGDIVSLVEKVQAGVAEEEALKIQEKIMNATFDFNDFVNQLEMMNNMGSMKQLMQMMPGTAKLSDADMEAAEKSMTIAKSLINSMTKEERQYPDMLVASTNAESRRARIIKGSGRKEADLANLIIMFGGMRTKMQQMSGQLGGKAASVGLTPQLSEAELTKLAMNKVRKTIKPGFVRRPKAKKVPKFLSERVEIEGKA
jgi:signal recognition particle subunit SRP54